MGLDKGEEFKKEEKEKVVRIVRARVFILSNAKLLITND